MSGDTRPPGPWAYVLGPREEPGEPVAFPSGEPLVDGDGPWPPLILDPGPPPAEPTP